MIRYPVYKPYLHGNESKYVNECLDSTWISSKGKYIEKFEDEFAKYFILQQQGFMILHLKM